MRTLNKFAFLSLLVTALVLSLFSGGGQMASAQGSIPDDELAYIDAGGFINIVDPVTPSGGTPFTWRSPTGGYTDMAALDVNGDGVDEIVAIAGGTVRLLVPFNTGGTPPQFSQTIPSGFQYVYVAAGDFVPGDGGRDEILVQRTDNRNNSTYSVQIYDGNADGASWQLVFDEVFGVNWIRLVGGDVDGDGKAEIVLAQSSAYRIYWSPDVNFNHSGDQAVSLRQPVVIQLGNFDGAGISTEPPSMVVSPKSLGFEMTRGESAPPAQTFQVTNAGGGILNVHVDARTVNGGDWLEVTPFDATAPETFTVRLKDVVTNMEPGAYDANITVTGTSSSGEVQDGEQVVTVRLTIRPTGPMLEVAPERYDFSMNFGGVIPSADPITIRNVGDGGRLFYRITVTTSDGGNWLKLSKSSGFTDDTVDVTLEPRNLTPGDYTALITVTADDAVSGSPATIPVTLHIDATGMVVTPAELFINAYKGQPSPMAEVHIDQAVEGSGAITWYAYVVPAGDWWDDFAPAFAAGDLDFVKRTAQGLVFRDGAGAERVLQYVPWVRLTPDHGVTPRIMQVTLDVPNAPVGETRVTIIVDGGPGTPNRFQGVDTRIVVAAEHGALWLPVVLNQ